MTNIFWEMSEPVWGRKKDFGKLQKKTGLKHDKQKGIKQKKCIKQPHEICHNQPYNAGGGTELVICRIPKTRASCSIMKNHEILSKRICESMEKILV